MTTQKMEAKTEPAKIGDQAKTAPSAQAAQKQEVVVYECLKDPKTIEALESTAKKYGMAAVQSLPHIAQAMVLAEGIRTIREQVKHILPQLKPLIGTPLGFLTDKDKEQNGYSDEILIDCIAQGLMKGVYPVNNEFNVIAGRMMIVKQGWIRKVTEIEGLTDLDIVPDVPKVVYGQNGSTSGAIVGFTASFYFAPDEEDAKPIHKTMKRTFAVKLFPGQGSDQAIGKGERRMYAAIYSYLTNTQITAEDDDAPPTSPTKQAQDADKSRTEALASRLKEESTKANVNSQEEHKETASNQ